MSCSTRSIWPTTKNTPSRAISSKTTKVTDHAGNIQLNAEQLPLGTYKVYEVAAPKGYELDKTVQTVNWDGSLVTTVTTNDNSLAYVSGLTTGYYEVREVTAPEGHILNDKVYGVNIDPYDPATDEDPRLVIENDPMPSLRIVKYDRDTGKPLESVTFKIYKDTVLFGTYSTDKAGEILLTGLEPGTYAVEEINAVTHVADAAPQQIELAAGRTDTATLVFFNSVKPGIHIRKVDADTDEPVAGAVFVVEQPDGHSVAEVTTGQNGSVAVPNLLPGAYVVTEKSVPAPYLRDAEAQTVTLYANRDRGGGAKRRVSGEVSLRDFRERRYGHRNL